MEYRTPKVIMNYSYFFNMNNSNIASKILTNLNFKYSTEFLFNNSYNTVGTYQPKHLSLGTSNYFIFYNYKTKLSTFVCTFNDGIFPYDTYIADINSEYASYEYLYSLMQKQGQFNWFDNSVISRLELLQARMISLGHSKEWFQFSIFMPFYSTDFEVNVTEVSIPKIINYEFEFFPKIQTNCILNYEVDTTLLRGELNFQWALGDPLTAAINYEVYRDDNTVYPKNLEFMRVFNIEDELNYEYSAGWEAIDVINIEMDSYISLVGRTEFEFNFGIKTDYQLNYEFDRDDNLIYPLSLEFHPIITDDTTFNFEITRVYYTEYNINLEFSRVYNEDYHLNYEFNSIIQKDYSLDLENVVTEVSKSTNLEFSRVYNEDYYLNYELDVYSINTNYTLNLESNVSPINNDRKTDLEFSRVYHDDYFLNYELGISSINKEYELSFETLLATYYDRNINVEFLKPFELNMKHQTYVIPFGFKDEFFMANIFCIIDADTNIEVNVANIGTDEIHNIESNVVINIDEPLDIELFVEAINKNYIANIEYDIEGINKDMPLAIEFQNVFTEDKITNIEHNISIAKDYVNNLETNIEINKAYELTLEYLQIISDDFPLDLEFNSVINMDAIQNIEITVDRLNHVYGLNFEHFVIVNKDFGLDLELFVNTVSKAFNLEFNILDLVYYFVSNGYNILPWWSDGTGNWDDSTEQDWNKDEDVISTLDNSFYNQLQDKGLTIPELINFSDSTQDNFGLIIPGTLDNNISLHKKFLYYNNVDDEHIMLLGKREKGSEEEVQLIKGENLIIWDGVEGTFNENVANQLSYIDNVQVYDQRVGEWKLVDDSTELFFEVEINNTMQPMPFIFNIKVTEDETFTIYR